jgi:hypothetical protein
MSRFFVTDPPVAIYEFNPAEVVSDKAPNIIWIRARMDVQTRGKVSSELVKIGKNGEGIEGHLGDNEMALLLHNIVRWEGPDFVDEATGQPVPCTPERIRTLDTADPFIARVVDEIGERNQKRKSPNPKSVTASGSMSAGEAGSTAPHPQSVSLQLATSPSRSSLRSALDGHLSRSDDSIPTT